MTGRGLVFPLRVSYPSLMAGSKGPLVQEGKPEKWVSDRHDYALEVE